jgi:hypothetical protein
MAVRRVIEKAGPCRKGRRPDAPSVGRPVTRLTRLCHIPAPHSKKSGRHRTAPPRHPRRRPHTVERTGRTGVDTAKGLFYQTFRADFDRTGNGGKTPFGRLFSPLSRARKDGFPGQRIDGEAGPNGGGGGESSTKASANRSGSSPIDPIGHCDWRRRRARMSSETPRTSGMSCTRDGPSASGRLPSHPPLGDGVNSPMDHPDDETQPEAPSFDLNTFPADALLHDRRGGRQRRGSGPLDSARPEGEPRRAPVERRARKERRRRIDPTTFEKQYIPRTTNPPLVVETTRSLFWEMICGSLISSCLVTVKAPARRGGQKSSRPSPDDYFGSAGCRAENLGRSFAARDQPGATA